MFCDLVDSTGLATRLDLDDLQELIGAYQEHVGEIVGRFGGFVARRVGDGVLSYFGYPHIEEDDAEQAVRAALAIISTVQELKGSEPVQVRIGIATGLVVVDDVAKGREVFGEGPNLAARLQGLAGPNTVIIAESTRRLVGSLFELEDLGAQRLKGFDEPQRSWRVLRENPLKSRFEALRSFQVPLIGREEELELMLRRWTQARSGEGRVILLSAEPGVGKSRLTVAVRERLGRQQYISLRYFCLPHYENSSLFPTTVQLQRAANFERDDSPEQKLDKLETLLAGVSTSVEDVALLAELMLLPTDRYPPVEPNPRRKKEKTFEALIRQLAGLANQKPVLVTFEDLHWIDPTSRELLDLTMERIKQLPVLLIATFRPDFQQAWAGQPHVTLLTLNRLGRADGVSLVRRVAGGTAALSEALIDDIVDRTDGVPLFLEEMTRAALETGGTAVRAREVLAGVPSPGVSVPPTLHASLMARLERLGPGPKELAQVGAAIGRQFSYELLTLVSPGTGAGLDENVAKLVNTGLVFQNGDPPRADFLFKHALVQEAAYGTLLRAPRQKLHARIAQALEQLGDETARSRPELIAHHLSEARLGERAIVYWIRAGELALRRSAAGEAITHLSNALRTLQELPDSRERARQELDIRLALGTAINTGRGSSDPEAAEHSARAVALARDLGDDKQLFRAVWGNWYVKSNTGQSEQALPLANELFSVAQRSADQDMILEAYHSRWATSHLIGHNATTLGDTEQGLAIYNKERHHSHAYNYSGHDTGVCALTHRAMTLWISGFPAQASQTSIAALNLARQLGHPPSLSHAAWWSATLRQFLGEPDACRELCDLTIKIAHEQGSKIFMMCPSLLGWTLYSSGQVAEGLRQMEQAVSAKRQRAHRFYYDYELLVFAEALINSGEAERAVDLVDEVLEFIKISRNRVFEAEAQRLKGACFAALGSERLADAAETWLLRAIGTAKQQGALSLELRAASSLARVWPDRDRRRKSAEVLGSVYRRFTEGFDTPDLKTARSVLQELEPVAASAD